MTPAVPLKELPAFYRFEWPLFASFEGAFQF